MIHISEKADLFITNVYLTSIIPDTHYDILQIKFCNAETAPLLSLYSVSAHADDNMRASPVIRDLFFLTTPTLTLSSISFVLFIFESRQEKTFFCL